MTATSGARLLGAALIAGCLASCGGSSGGPSGGSTTSPAATPAATPTGLASRNPSLPPEAAATQGEKYYAVFLAVATDVNDQTLVAAQQRAKELGYAGGVGELTCTPGAQEQLNLPATASYTAFSILFATKEQAATFVRAYNATSGPSGTDVVGTAYVTAGCLD
jgi:hypothetical protein